MAQEIDRELELIDESGWTGCSAAQCVDHVTDLVVAPLRSGVGRGNSYNPDMCVNSWRAVDTSPRGVQFCPGDMGTVWVPPQSLWRTKAGAVTDNLLRIWWYLDEVELQWKALAAAVEFPWIELEWGKGSNYGDFDVVVDAIARFISVEKPEIQHLRSHVGSKIRYSGAADASRGRALCAAVKGMRHDYLAALKAAISTNSAIQLGLTPGVNGSAAAPVCAELFRHIK